MENNFIKCANCGADSSLHCKKCQTPCCPGKCPKEKPKCGCGTNAKYQIGSRDPYDKRTKNVCNRCYTAHKIRFPELMTLKVYK